MVASAPGAAGPPARSRAVELPPDALDHRAAVRQPQTGTAPRVDAGRRRDPADRFAVGERRGDGRSRRSPAGLRSSSIARTGIAQPRFVDQGGSCGGRVGRGPGRGRDSAAINWWPAPGSFSSTPAGSSRTSRRRARCWTCSASSAGWRNSCAAAATSSAPRITCRRRRRSSSCMSKASSPRPRRRRSGFSSRPSKPRRSSIAPASRSGKFTPTPPSTRARSMSCRRFAPRAGCRAKAASARPCRS